MMAHFMEVILNGREPPARGDVLRAGSKAWKVLDAPRPSSEGRVMVRVEGPAMDFFALGRSLVSV